MKIEKSFIVSASKQRVWEFITCPHKVSPCIPGCEQVEIVEEGKYKTTIKMKVGPINTKFSLFVELTEQRPMDYSAYLTRGEEGGRASRISAESILLLKVLDENRTEVSYSSEITVLGRLARFGFGVMKKKADAINEEFINNFCRSVEMEQVCL